MIYTERVSGQSSDPPNIVLVMCDDLGCRDLACYRSPTVKTPHIDSFAKLGMRFTEFLLGSAELFTISQGVNDRANSDPPRYP